MIRALIVDGQNNHDWVALTGVLREILGETGKFDVAVTTTPPKGSPPAAWDGFRPDFTSFDVVVSNYFGEDWPAETLNALTAWARAGGGFVAVHAGGSSCQGHAAYSRMVGLGWNEPDFGDRLTLAADNHVVRTPRGSGPGAGHGKPFAYPVTSEVDHPILADLPPIWLHAADELWHGLRGPAEEVTILASSFSPRTKAREPLLWTVGYGAGRVFVTVLGHLMDPAKADAVECVGFRATLARGCQWAATGEVDLPVPKNFPSEGETSKGPAQYA